MVFIGRLKTDIRKILTRFFFIVAAIFATSIFVFNAVFAKTGMDIPVSVNWTDQSASSRPSSVTLQLKDGNTVVKTITLTSANQSQSDSNKWEGVFDSVPYNDNYTISESDVDGYTITANNLSPTINNTVSVSSSTRTTNTESQSFGDVNFVLMRSNSGTYYLWTLENYSGTKYTQLINALKATTGNNSLSVSSSNYKATLPSSYTIYSVWIFSETVEIEGTEGNISLDHNVILTNRIDEIYYGNVVTGTSDGVTFENVKAVDTYTLTVHHLNEDGTKFAEDVVTEYEDGDTYTASPISNNRYTSELTSGQATGTITQDIEVTYTYHPKFHTVTYEFSGDVLPPNASQLLPAAAEHDDGTTVTVAQNPTATGYRFLGWKINGEDAGTSFTMPSENVTISGSWEQFNGTFAPTISKTISNPQNIYRFGDTVEFLVTISNPESYPINNVEVEEKLIGAKFIAHSGYTVDSTDESKAIIPTIPAGGTVVLYAEYDIVTDNTETLTNRVELTSASADNYYFLDTTQEYIASADFSVQSWQDVPVLTGVNTNSTILYYVLFLIGAIGIGGSIVVHRQTKTK